MKKIYQVKSFNYNMNGNFFSPLWLEGETVLFFENKKDAEDFCIKNKTNYIKYEITEQKLQ